MYAAGDYEPDVVGALHRLVRRGFVCADVGAHLGYFTLLLGRLVGDDGRVVAFEAAPENARVVRENVRINGLADRVTVENAAAVDTTIDELDLYAGRVGGSTEWTVSPDFATREDSRPADLLPPSFRVRGLALDDYFPPGSSIDLVKMDIEGAEALALHGMRLLLADARPIILLEFHRQVGWPGIEVLLEAGYLLEEIGGEPLAVPAGPEDVPYHLVARPQR